MSGQEQKPDFVDYVNFDKSMIPAIRLDRVPASEAVDARRLASLLALTRTAVEQGALDYKDLKALIVKIEESSEQSVAKKPIGE